MLICPPLLDAILADLCARSNQLSSPSIMPLLLPGVPVTASHRPVPAPPAEALAALREDERNKRREGQMCSQSLIY